MYKCLSLESGELILILSSKWRQEEKKLRFLAAGDKLVCQGCNQPVRLKAGKMRRWHFAHKHLENCPFIPNSPILIYARGKIYDWLVGLYGESYVDVEVFYPQLKFPRPIDVSVRTRHGNCSIWIVESRMKPDIRKKIRQNFTDLGEPYFYVFLNGMHHPMSGQQGKINLSTTERECAQTSDYDYFRHPIDLPIGQTLHYFDPENNQVITYRDLTCIHKPQVYKGRPHVDGLEKLVVDIIRGSLVHPGEAEELNRLIRLREHRREKVERSRKSLGKIMDRILPDHFDEQGKDDSQLSEKKSVLNFKNESVSTNSETFLNRPARCMFCGVITDDWWFLDRVTGLCKCRTCLKKDRNF